MSLGVLPVLVVPVLVLAIIAFLWLRGKFVGERFSAKNGLVLLGSFIGFVIVDNALSVGVMFILLRLFCGECGTFANPSEPLLAIPFAWLVTLILAVVFRNRVWIVTGIVSVRVLMIVPPLLALLLFGLYMR